MEHARIVVNWNIDSVLLALLLQPWTKPPCEFYVRGGAVCNDEHIQLGVSCSQALQPCLTPELVKQMPLKRYKQASRNLRSICSLQLHRWEDKALKLWRPILVPRIMASANKVVDHLILPTGSTGFLSVSRRQWPWQRGKWQGKHSETNANLTVKLICKSKLGWCMKKKCFSINVVDHHDHTTNLLLPFTVYLKFTVSPSAVHRMLYAVLYRFDLLLHCYHFTDLVGRVVILASTGNSTGL